MNNKGQVIFYTLMIAICVIVLALAFSPVLKESVENARASGSLDCANESISLFDKTTCIVTDTSQFLFIVGLIFIAGAIITARLIFSE
jgi:hypothetical protein